MRGSAVRGAADPALLVRREALRRLLPRLRDAGETLLACLAENRLRAVEAEILHQQDAVIWERV